MQQAQAPLLQSQAMAPQLAPQPQLIMPVAMVRVLVSVSFCRSSFRLSFLACFRTG
jgi:hypothetical protein